MTSCFNCHKDFCQCSRPGLEAPRAHVAAGHTHNIDLMPLSEEAAMALLLATLPAYCCLERCWYAGAQLVAQSTLKATMHAGRVMLDLSYCMKEAINQNIERTVPYEPAAF